MLEFLLVETKICVGGCDVPSAQTMGCLVSAVATTVVHSGLQEPVLVPCIAGLTCCDHFPCWPNICPRHTCNLSQHSSRRVSGNTLDNIRYGYWESIRFYRNMTRICTRFD